MDRDLFLKLNEEVKKMRNDLDAIKAYTKTIAENTTPAEDSTPAGESEPVG